MYSIDTIVDIVFVRSAWEKSVERKTEENTENYTKTWKILNDLKHKFRMKIGFVTVVKSVYVPEFQFRIENIKMR